MSIFVEKEAAIMPINDTTTPIKKGGAIWLVCFIGIGLLWMSDLAIWPTILCAWSIVSMVFALVRNKQRYISFNGCLTISAMTLLTTTVLWFLGDGITRSAFEVGIHTDYAIGYAIILAILLVVCATGWLLASAFVRGSAEGGSSPVRIVTGAWRILNDDRRIWSLGLMSSALHMLSCLIAYNCGASMQTVVGIAASFVQVKMLGVVNQPATEGLRCVTSEQRPANSLILGRLSILFLFVLIIGFYIALPAMGDMSIGWSWLKLLVMPWVSGACIALLAWLIGLFRPLYIFVILSIVIVNAIMLGLMIAIFDSMIFT